MNYIYDTLKKLIDQTKRKPAMHIYKDEETGHIKEELLSKDMAASAYINNTVIRNQAKLIHNSIFGK